MNAKATLSTLRATALALIAGLMVTAPAQVYAAGHSVGGGGHFSGGAAGHGGYGGAYRGGYYGRYGHYGYGYRGGYWGWRGGYGWGWWGWPVGGLFLATLPFYYSTLWWNGVPYYYADDNYYIWSNSANGYVGVAPPPQVVNQAAQAGGAPYPTAPPGGTDLFVYPKNGQSVDQIARDRQECQSWAASQAGGGSDNLRAQTACLEGRGYSVK